MKLGVLALSALLVIGTLPVAGCNTTTIAQDIVNWTPTVESTAATVASTVAVLLPADAVIIAGAVAGFNAAANLVDAEAKAYLANPNQTTLQALQTAVVTFQQSISSSLLSAVKIVDAKSQAAVTAAINALATSVNAIIGLISQIKGNTISSTASTAVKTSLNDLKGIYKPDVYLVASHYGYSSGKAAMVIESEQDVLQAEGF